MKKVTFSLQRYIEICNRELHDRATQNDIRRLLKGLYPDIRISNNEICQIRKELGRLRQIRLEEAKRAFREKYGDFFDFHGLIKYFTEAGFNLTKAEINAMLKTDLSAHLTIRISPSENAAINLISERNALSRSFAARMLLLIGAGTLLSDYTPIDLVEKVRKGLQAGAGLNTWQLSRIDEVLIDAIKFNFLKRRP